jgi:hypothetical protein
MARNYDPAGTIWMFEYIVIASGTRDPPLLLQAGNDLPAICLVSRDGGVSPLCCMCAGGFGESIGTKAGEPYCKTYCLVFRFEAGKRKEVRNIRTPNSRCRFWAIRGSEGGGTARTIHLGQM